MSDVPAEVEEEIVNPEVATEEAVEEPPQIEIGDRSFKTEAEALAYAREQMVVESAKADAFRQGIELAQRNVTSQNNVTPTPNTPVDNTQWEQEFYANPKDAIAKAMASAALEGEKRALGKVTQQNEDQRLWNKFTDQNPDLADFRRDVEVMGDEHKEIIMTLAKTKGEDEAIKFLAQKTRAKFQQWAEKAKPGNPLPNKGGGASPSGSGGGKNVTKTDDKKSGAKGLSFVEQMKQNKRRHVQ